MPNNKTGSLKRLASLVQRLKRNGKLEDYDAIIQQQLEEGVVEEAEEPAQVKEFYIPHKAVIRESSETTKLRIVYDASARAYDAAPFLNQCLELRPPLKNQLWKVLVRGRFMAVAIAVAIHTSSFWPGPITFPPRRSHSASPQHLYQRLSGVCMWMTC